MHFSVKSEKPGVWLMDVQERLFPRIERCCDLLSTLCLVLKSAKLFDLPVFVTEQSPDHLGPTIDQIQQHLPSGQPIYSKTLFSGYADEMIRHAIDKMPQQEWILIGIEAHICILQTAKDLLASGKRVIILNDAISSRSIYDYSTSISELRDAGARITSAETIFYEFIRDANAPSFKEFVSLVKQHAHA